MMEEAYFKPIYDWHASRGMIFACDSGGRGRNPHEFGDYFRATRWYSAPGHDTPGGRADLIKGKVSSSIANLYRRPRVWLEAYHSLGWGATPERLMFATRENYLYGCTLLNLHGLYYSTYGSHWEWAPPCYHFRMPYWPHMDVFLKYFDRLSYLMSQGHHVCPQYEAVCLRVPGQYLLGEVVVPEDATVRAPIGVLSPFPPVAPIGHIRIFVAVQAGPDLLVAQIDEFALKVHYVSHPPSKLFHRFQRIHDQPISLTLLRIVTAESDDLAHW